MLRQNSIERRRWSPAHMPMSLPNASQRASISLRRKALASTAATCCHLFASLSLSAVPSNLMAFTRDFASPLPIAMRGHNFWPAAARPTAALASSLSRMPAGRSTECLSRVARSTSVAIVSRTRSRSVSHHGLLSPVIAAFHKGAAHGASAATCVTRATSSNVLASCSPFSASSCEMCNERAGPDRAASLCCPAAVRSSCHFATDSAFGKSAGEGRTTPKWSIRSPVRRLASPAARTSRSAMPISDANRAGRSTNQRCASRSETILFASSAGVSLRGPTFER